MNRVSDFIKTLPLWRKDIKENKRWICRQIIAGWCDVVIFTCHLKRYLCRLTGMTGGVMSRGKSHVTRDRTSSPPESSRNTYKALPALTLPVPSVLYTTRGQRHKRTTALEMRHDRLPSSRKHWSPWRFTSIDTSMPRLSPPSIAREQRTGRTASTTWPGTCSLGHLREDSTARIQNSNFDISYRLWVVCGCFVFSFYHFGVKNAKMGEFLKFAC